HRDPAQHGRRPDSSERSAPDRTPPRASDRRRGSHQISHAPGSDLRPEAVSRYAGIARAPLRVNLVLTGALSSESSAVDRTSVRHESHPGHVDHVSGAIAVSGSSRCRWTSSRPSTSRSSTLSGATPTCRRPRCVIAFLRRESGTFGKARRSPTCCYVEASDSIQIARERQAPQGEKTRRSDMRYAGLAVVILAGTA